MPDLFGGENYSPLSLNDMEPKKVLHKLYLSLLALFFGLTGVLFFSYVVVDVHDHWVSKSDFECVDRLFLAHFPNGQNTDPKPKFDDTLPFEAVGVAGVDPPFDEHASWLRSSGNLTQCNLVWIPWKTGFASQRAWSEGLRETNFFSRGTVFLWFGLISLSLAILTFVIHKWLVWLTK